VLRPLHSLSCHTPFPSPSRKKEEDRGQRVVTQCDPPVAGPCYSFHLSTVFTLVPYAPSHELKLDRIPHHHCTCLTGSTCCIHGSHETATTTIMNSETSALPSITTAPTHIEFSRASESPLSSADSSAVASEDDSLRPSNSNRLSRPRLGSRKSSGTMIVPRESTEMVVDDDIEEGDVRTMSPRRNSEEVDKLGEEARKDLIQQAKVLQTSLQAIVDKVETVKTEHEKLEGGNKFLQSYIGELMQTSKITSSAPPKKGKGRSNK